MKYLSIFIGVALLALGQSLDCHSKPDGYGKISQCITTAKHSKAKTVCIFLGIYCTSVHTSSYQLALSLTIFLVSINICEVPHIVCSMDCAHGYVELCFVVVVTWTFNGFLRFTYILYVFLSSASVGQPIIRLLQDMGNIDRYLLQPICYAVNVHISWNVLYRQQRACISR